MTKEAMGRFVAAGLLAAGLTGAPQAGAVEGDAPCGNMQPSNKAEIRGLMEKLGDALAASEAEVAAHEALTPHVSGRLFDGSGLVRRSSGAVLSRAAVPAAGASVPVKADAPAQKGRGAGKSETSAGRNRPHPAPARKGLSTPPVPSPAASAASAGTAASAADSPSFADKALGGVFMGALGAMAFSLATVSPAAIVMGAVLVGFIGWKLAAGSI